MLTLVSQRFPMNSLSKASNDFVKFTRMLPALLMIAVNRSTRDLRKFRPV